MTYLLDTNVVSELRRSTRKAVDTNVERWVGNVDATELFLSVVNILELEMGVLGIEDRDSIQGALLRSWFRERILPTFEGRILPFDTETAMICARLNVPNRRPRNDSIIAATALRHHLILVTRNVADFQGTGVPLINPWDT